MVGATVQAVPPQGKQQTVAPNTELFQKVNF
jgi:hypothetical protein